MNHMKLEFLHSSGSESQPTKPAGVLSEVEMKMLEDQIELLKTEVMSILFILFTLWLDVDEDSQIVYL